MEEELRGLWKKECYKDEDFLSDGENEPHMARLIARGFNQRPGVDLFEKFDPVISFDVVRTILAISAIRG